MTAAGTPDPVASQPVDTSPLSMIRPSSFLPIVGPAPMPGGDTGIVLRYEHATGSTVLLLSAAQAMEHGRALIKAGREASTGLVLPTGGSLLRP